MPELQFQRPKPELELSRDDARPLGISTGDDLTVSSNGTSVRLRARVSRSLRKGVVRAPAEHAGGLEGPVKVEKGSRAPDAPLGVRSPGGQYE